MRTFIRKIEHIVTSYEIVTTNSTDASYVEHDKRSAQVATIPVKPDRINVIEDWRAATPFETAVYEAGEGFKF